MVTTSGPSSLTCDDISGYVDETAFLQCQIVSNNFDIIVLSHLSHPSTGSVLLPLGSLTKTSAVVTTTDPAWSGLGLAYHTAGSLEYINVTLPKIACAMSGAFTLNLTNGNFSSVTTSQINVLVKPTSPPTISQRTYLDVSTEQIECTGDVGNPAVQMTLHASNGNSNNSFVEMTSQSTSDDTKDGCTFTRTIRSTASLASMNGTDVKCVTSYSNIGTNLPTTLESNSLTILLISGNICESTNATFILHPYDCHKYIHCGDSTSTEVSCAATTCFTIPGNKCDNDCSRCP
ncbi:uncharacterized protein LOC110456327 [Mizuhopecten yessoensis]|uniref:uncharacterized protein LOC110456327 n=1 Tax=Mizuhopecten yessoensis TaxID=6573 RepID=UPI000B45ED2F|nr:uncharacterized protein LOC110456327 [Mizuhopecten yessoensis]